MDWLVNTADLGLFHLYTSSPGVSPGSWKSPLNLATSILSTGFLKGQGSQAVQITPALSWIAILVIVVVLGRYAKDWKLAALGRRLLWLSRGLRPVGKCHGDPIVDRHRRSVRGHGRPLDRHFWLIVGAGSKG